MVEASPSLPGPPSGTGNLAVGGDSISEAGSHDFSAGRPGDASWVCHAVGDGVRFAGGWAVSGAVTAQTARNSRPVHADVLVILVGTDDVHRGLPFATCAANLRSIADTVGAPRVVVSSIPPIVDRCRDPGARPRWTLRIRDDPAAPSVTTEPRTPCARSAG